jgi:thiol-disulfide isomerase/thioredoxin
MFMKNSVLLLTLLLLVSYTSSFAQKGSKGKPKDLPPINLPASSSAPSKDSLKPYQRNNKFPVFRMLDMDSSTLFNTGTLPDGKPIMLFYFGAECDHCFHMWEKLAPSLDSLNGVKIVMATFSNPTPIRKFYEKYDLGKYKNIVIGRDYDFFLGPFYDARSVPVIVIYDKHKKFVVKWEEALALKDLTVTDLYKAAFGLAKPK